MPIDSNNSTTLFESPADQVDALAFPDDLWKQLKDVYDQTLPEGQAGGMEVTDIHLARRQPSDLETEGEWDKEEGWVVCKCALTSARFAVPEDEPVPTVTTEHRFTDGTKSTSHDLVHPELAAERSQVALHLIGKLARKIQERLFALIGVTAKLEALSEMEELPKTVADEPDVKRRSSCEYESIDSLP